MHAASLLERTSLLPNGEKAFTPVTAAAARAVPAVNEICYVTRNIDEGVMRFLGVLSIWRHARVRRPRSTGNECGNATPPILSTENGGGHRCENGGGNATPMIL